jgi:hypothetical protein
MQKHCIFHVRHNIGVATPMSFEIKSVDEFWRNIIIKMEY